MGATLTSNGDRCLVPQSRSDSTSEAEHLDEKEPSGTTGHSSLPVTGQFSTWHQPHTHTVPDTTGDRCPANAWGPGNRHRHILVASLQHLNLSGLRQAWLSGTLQVAFSRQFGHPHQPYCLSVCPSAFWEKLGSDPIMPQQGTECPANVCTG